jgi:hypothetical protein
MRAAAPEKPMTIGAPTALIDELQHGQRRPKRAPKGVIVGAWNGPLQGPFPCAATVRAGSRPPEWCGVNGGGGRCALQIRKRLVFLAMVDFHARRPCDRRTAHILRFVLYGATYETFGFDGFLLRSCGLCFVVANRVADPL